MCGFGNHSFSILVMHVLLITMVLIMTMLNIMVIFVRNEPTDVLTTRLLVDMEDMKMYDKAKIDLSLSKRVTCFSDGHPSLPFPSLL